MTAELQGKVSHCGLKGKDCISAGLRVKNRRSSSMSDVSIICFFQTSEWEKKVSIWYIFSASMEKWEQHHLLVKETWQICVNYTFWKMVW